MCLEVVCLGGGVVGALWGRAPLPMRRQHTGADGWTVRVTKRYTHPYTCVQVLKLVQTLANEWARGVLAAAAAAASTAQPPIIIPPAAGAGIDGTTTAAGAGAPPASSADGQQEGPTRLLPFGSYRLDVHDPSSDLDLLLVAPKGVGRGGFFGAFVERHLRGHPAVGGWSCGCLCVCGGVGVIGSGAPFVQPTGKLTGHAKNTKRTGATGERGVPGAGGLHPRGQVQRARCVSGLEKTGGERVYT